MPKLSTYMDDKARENFQKNVYIIYVEGTEDVDFLNFLYPASERDIEFQWAGKPSDNPAIPTDGGCNGVIQRVCAERKMRSDGRVSNDRVYGIIDRDYYKTSLKWQEFLEPDNDKFSSRIHNGVVVLRRWEIENYFVDPRVIKNMASRLANKGNGGDFNDDDIANVLLNLCERLIVIGAASLVLHQHGKRDLDLLWGNEIKTVDRTLSEIVSSLENHSIDKAKEEFEQRLAEMRRFDCDSDDNKKRIRHLLRIIDGKRLFTHISHRYKFGIDPRRQAASDCCTHSADMEDLADFIDPLIGRDASHRVRASGQRADG